MPPRQLIALTGEIWDACKCGVFYVGYESPSNSSRVTGPFSVAGPPFANIKALRDGKSCDQLRLTPELLGWPWSKLVSRLSQTALVALALIED